MLTKKQFQPLYSECVLKIGEMKAFNDKINKAIGIVGDQVVDRQIEKDKLIMDELSKKVQGNLKKMEKSYLDPGTMRKIGMVRQQLSLQRDRREQLKISIDKLIASNKIQQKKQIKRLNKQETKAISTNYAHNKQNDRIINLQNETVKQKESLLTETIQSGLQSKLLSDRKQQFTQISSKLWNINYVTKQMANFVEVTGQRIDIINQNLQKTGDNVDLSNIELKQANQSNKKRTRKYIILSIIMLIIMGLIILLIFFM